MEKQRTNIIVRPAARGGKYLGPDAANRNQKSAVVLVLNAKTDEILTFGVVDAPVYKNAGPNNIMSPVSRAEPFPTDLNTVLVQVSVDISEPTDLRISVFGPLSQLDQARLAQADITVLPGVDIGLNAYDINTLMPSYPEGLVIEVPGLCISDVIADWSKPEVAAFARVTMMCGCPINDEPGSYWPSKDFAVQLVTYMQSGAVYKYDLTFTPTPTQYIKSSTFKGQWKNQATDGDTVLQAWIYASQPKLGNQGKYQIYPKPTLQLPPIVQKILSEIEE